MNRLLLVLLAAVGLSGCIVHPLGLRPPPPHPGGQHHRPHGERVKVVVGHR